MKRLAVLAALAASAGSALAVAGPAGSGDPIRRAAADRGAPHRVLAPVERSAPDERLATAESSAPDGLLVLAALSPERALVADPRTGAARERVLAGGTLCHGPLLAAGDRVVLTGMRERHAVALALPLSLTGRWESLGRADSITPSATPGRLWLGRWSVEGPDMPVGVRLREVAADGAVVAHRNAVLDRWSMLVGAVDGGFVTQDVALELWSPPFDRPRRSIRGGWLLAVHGDGFAWCRDPCRVPAVWRPEGERTLPPPDGVRTDLAGRAAFSPDGRRLALPVKAHGRWRVGVVDVATGEWRMIRGAPLTGYRAIAWSPSGRWIFFTGRRDRLFASRDGGPPVRLPIRTRGAVMSIASTAGSPGR